MTSVPGSILAGAALALEPPRPNPGRGALGLAFTLATASPARLELLDLAGRRVLTHDPGAPGAGRHLVEIPRASSLAPGLYVLRLIQDGKSVARRVTLLR